MPSVFLFFQLSDYGKLVWKFWVSFPDIVHKSICMISLIWIFWSVVLSKKAILLALKKDYEKNQ